MTATQSPQLPPHMLGATASMVELHRSIDKLAMLPGPVLITGESGVGKELVARALHERSHRAGHPFVAIRLASIPEPLFDTRLFGRDGAFETARTGSLFLDEIGELPETMQAALIRTLDGRPELRLFTTSHRDLDALIAGGRFRADLRDRLAAHRLAIPPLRERRDDIPMIAAHYLTAIALREHRPGLELTTAAIAKLRDYTWPGNLRELRNLLERAALLTETDQIDIDHVVFTQRFPRRRTAVGSVPPYRETTSPGVAPVSPYGKRGARA
ncbi:MAG: sigma 54-interacting transcriptional regulator [Kofleriaceae bacterium]